MGGVMFAEFNLLMMMFEKFLSSGHCEGRKPNRFEMSPRTVNEATKQIKIIFQLILWITGRHEDSRLSLFDRGLKMQTHFL